MKQTHCVTCQIESKYVRTWKCYLNQGCGDLFRKRQQKALNVRFLKARYRYFVNCAMNAQKSVISYNSDIY